MIPITTDIESKMFEVRKTNRGWAASLVYRTASNKRRTVTARARLKSELPGALRTAVKRQFRRAEYLQNLHASLSATTYEE